MCLPACSLLRFLLHCSYILRTESRCHRHPPPFVQNLEPCCCGMSLHHVGMGIVQYLQKQQTPYRWYQWVVLTVAHGLLGLVLSVALVACLVDLARRAAPPRSVEYAPSEALAMQQASAPARNCLLYTSPSPRDRQKSRMPSSA